MTPAFPTLPYDLRVMLRWCAPLLIAYMAADLLMLLHRVRLIAFFADVEAGSIAQADLIARGESIDALGLVLGIGYVGIFVACVIACGMWIYRAAANAGTIQPEAGRISPGWAVGWLFVPIAALWKPYQAMRQTWNTSVRPDLPMDTPGPGILVGWWWAWVISNILANVSFRLWMRADDLETFRGTAILDIITAPISLVATYLFLRILRRITRKQAALQPARTLETVPTTFPRTPRPQGEQP